MERKTGSVSMIVYGGALISAIVAFVSLFFNYSVSTTGTYTRTGFHIFNSAHTAGKVWIVIFIILALAIVALALIRLLGMLGDKTYGYVMAILGLALLVVSIILFVMIPKATWAGYTYEYKRGIGLILNLIFSILTSIFCVCSMLKLGER